MRKICKNNRQPFQNRSRSLISDIFVVGQWELVQTQGPCVISLPTTHKFRVEGRANTPGHEKSSPFGAIIQNMYAIAIIGDLLSLIPIVNLITTPATAIALSIAGSHTGVSLWTPERAGATLVCCVLELIPGISFIPTWTIRVWWAKRGQQSTSEW